MLVFLQRLLSTKISPFSKVAELGVSPIEVIPLRELSRVNLEAQILEASSEGEIRALTIQRIVTSPLLFVFWFKSP